MSNLLFQLKLQCMHCSWSNKPHDGLLPYQLPMHNKDPTALPSPLHLFLLGLHNCPKHYNKKRPLHLTKKKRTMITTMKNAYISQANSYYNFKCNWKMLIRILTMICNVINPPSTLLHLHLSNRLSIPFYDHLCKAWQHSQLNKTT